jgi:hypothetical protein
MAIRDLRRNPNLSGWGRAIVGLVLGILGTLGLVLPLLLGAIASIAKR